MKIKGLVSDRMNTPSFPPPNTPIFTARIFGELMTCWVNSAKLVSLRFSRWQHERDDMTVAEAIEVFGSLVCSNGLLIADNLPRA